MGRSTCASQTISRQCTATHDPLLSARPIVGTILWCQAAKDNHRSRTDFLVTTSCIPDTLPLIITIQPGVHVRERGYAIPAVPLTTAIATYGHTKPLKDSTIQSERVVLEHLEVSPITSAFRRLVRTLAFDISEMASSPSLRARAKDKPITALPIFLLRRFEHGGI